MGEFRLVRLGEQIRAEISKMLLSGQIKDPRVSTFLSINRVDVSADLGYAKVYVSSFMQDKSVEKGVKDTVSLYYEEPFSYVSTDGSDFSAIEKRLELPPEINAPIVKGDIAGRAVYLLNGKEIGFVNILYAETVELATLGDYFMDLLKEYLIA